MTTYQQYRSAKIFLVIAALLVTVGIVWLRATAARWHVSLINHVPRVLLVMMVLAVIVSIAGVCWFGKYDDTITAVAALAPFGVVMTFFYELPSLLGYKSQIGDIVVHLSAVNVILVGHRIPDTSYPLSYLTAAAIGYTTGVDARAALTILAAAAFVCFLLVTATHAHAIEFPATGAVLFVPVVATLYAVPARITYATLFVTAAFAGISSLTVGQKSRWRYLAIVVGLVPPLVLSHPLAAINLTFYGGLAAGIALIARYAPWGQTPPWTISTGRIGILMAGVGATSVWVWISYGRTELLHKVGATISASLIGASRPQTASKSTVTDSLLGQFGFSLKDILKIAIQLYGDWLALLSIAGVVFIICAIIMWRGDNPRITVFHAIFVLLPPFVMVGEFATDAFPGLGFTRLIRPALYIAPAVAAGIVWLYQHHGNWIARIQPVIALLMVTSVVAAPIMLAGANHYNNPEWTLSVNSYRSDAEITGYSWFFTNKNHGIWTKALWRRPTRVAGDLLGRSESRRRSNELGGGRDDRVSRHLGNGTLGNSSGMFYFTDGRRDRAMLLDALKGSNRLSKIDLRRLQADPTVNKIFANGELNVSVVNPPVVSQSRLK